MGIPVVRLHLEDPELNPPSSLFARAARAFGLIPHDVTLVLVPGLDCAAEALAARILEIGTAAIEAAAEAEKDAKKAQPAPEAVNVAEVAPEPVPAKESFKLVELMTTAGGEISVVIEIDGEKTGAKAKRGLLLKTFPQLKDII